MTRLERLAELDRRLVAAATSVSLLAQLSWPEEVLEAFLVEWRLGRAMLPSVPKPQVDVAAAVEAFESIIKEADHSDPMGRYLGDTASSYRLAAELLTTAGTPAFLRASLELYGSPQTHLPGSQATHLDAADILLEVTRPLVSAGRLAEEELCLTAEYVADVLREQCRKSFVDHEVEVIVDPGLAAKAAAGARRIRIRGRTCFSEMDVAQLIQHEALVHTATALNGRTQPTLTSMGLSAPRTTLTQEGLATLAELATRSIDIARLRRLALRTRGTQLALEGADFIEVFKFFLEQGQSEEESARSAMRIFRGGDPHGGIVFTKDVVYLCGLVAVHTFLRKAIADDRPELVGWLFAGRVALGDVVRLEEAFLNGEVAAPRYLPDWAKNMHTLAAYLAFSLVANRVNLGAIDLAEV